MMIAAEVTTNACCANVIEPILTVVVSSTRVAIKLNGKMLNPGKETARAWPEQQESIGSKSRRFPYLDCRQICY
jgi:hypothetical protein